MAYLGSFLIGCSDNHSEEKNLRNVILTQPLPTGETSSETFSGIIQEGKNVNASFMADGKIRSLLVKEGDRIKKGQLLAVLDDTDYQIGVNQLKAQFNQMTEEKKRMDEMFARHNIAPNDYEKFSAGYEQLKLQMEMAENKLGYTRLYSPTDGFVSEKFMEPGELVGAGTPVFKITDDTSLMAVVDLPVNVYLNRENITSLEGFSPVFRDTSIPLTLESFNPDASNNMLYQMKLTIPSLYTQNLTPGMNIKVVIKTKDNEAEGFMIPVRSIADENGDKFVWVYNLQDSTIHKTPIKIVGMVMDKNITVSGLNGNEKIVETGVKQLYEGEKVHISNNSDYGL